MANELEKARFALLAALQPDQFIDLAVAQGFTPQQMSKGIPNFTPKMGPAAKKAATAAAQPAPATPSTPPGPPKALQLLMGLQGQMPGAPPPPVQMPPGVATQPGAIGSLKAPPGAGAIPGMPGIDINALLRAGAGLSPGGTTAPITTTGAPPPPLREPVMSQGPVPQIPPQGVPPDVPPQLRAMIGLPAQVQQPTALQLPPRMPDVVDMGAGALGGVAAKALAPSPIGGPLGVTPPPQQSMGAIPSTPPRAVPPLSQIATPPTSILSLLGLGGGPTLPAPAGGIMDDPSVAAMSPDQSAVSSGLPAGGQDPTQALAGLAGTIFPPLPGGLSNPGVASVPPPPVRVGLGLPPPMTPAVAGAVPPPPPPGTTPAVTPVATGPRLRPVSSAPVETGATTKEPPSTGSPEERKATFDALASVGKAGLGGGRGGVGRGAPGSAGVRAPNIQSGELLDLILKSLKPADYSPGYIPYGKLF